MFGYGPDNNPHPKFHPTAPLNTSALYKIVVSMPDDKWAIADAWFPASEHGQHGETAYSAPVYRVSYERDEAGAILWQFDSLEAAQAKWREMAGC